MKLAPRTWCADDQALAVRVRRDPANDIWFVERSEIPGLNAEAPSLDELVDIIRDLAPDLVDDSGSADKSGTPPDISIRLQHLVNARRTHAG